jgi:UDP-N-acetylmuramoyl-tripeptide--D-alanyl-D-alanine ligase
VTSILAAVACGIVCGLDLKTCAEAISKFEPPMGRCSVHRTPVGAFYVFEHKAPFWTIANSLNFVREAQAPRKTVVFGTISDYPGSASSHYKRAARAALEVADRVVFVGAQSSHVSKLRKGELQDRVFAFQTTYQATEFLRQETSPSELILLKGSNSVDHFERIPLAQIETVVCWKQSCRVKRTCLKCPNYHKAAGPPFGLAQAQALAVANV